VLGNFKRGFVWTLKEAAKRTKGLTGFEHRHLTIAGEAEHEEIARLEALNKSLRNRCTDLVKRMGDL